MIFGVIFFVQPRTTVTITNGAAGTINASQPRIDVTETMTVTTTAMKKAATQMIVCKVEHAILVANMSTDE